MAGFRERTRVFWRDFGLSEYGKAVRDGRPPPAPEPHHYRRCRDEDCPEELCQAYREGLEDGREDT